MTLQDSSHKKYYLFLDTSFFIQIGILREDFSFLHHEVVANRKGAQFIHGHLYKTLKSLGIEIFDFEGIILANGPGSYTGVRIGEGIAQILMLEGMKIASFYHYEVPLLCGIKSYQFFERAFKREVFHYINGDKGPEKSLIGEDEFRGIDFSLLPSFHLTGELLDKSIGSIYNLYKKYPSQIFSKVWTLGEHKSPYYFRSAEREFKMTGNGK